MSVGTGTVENLISKVIEIDGIRLEIHVQRIAGEGRALCIINELGIMSHWADYFETAQDALAAVRESIENEGVEVFVNAEDFGYLLH